ncbi:MAG: hypothetical protein IKW04_06750 [Clostridia bacterium]|nr:hypothetical protein [Clostridia bacterium]
MCKWNCFIKKLLYSVSIVLNIVLLIIILILSTNQQELFSYSMVDIIGLFVSIGVGCATFYLGYVANKQNERLTQIEKNSSDIKRSSCVVLEKQYHGCKLSNDYKTYPDETERKLYLKIYNCGEAMLKQIEVDFGNQRFGSYLALAKEQGKNIKIPIPDDFKLSQAVTIKYISCYKVTSYATFRLEKLNDFSDRYTRKYYHYEGLEENVK